MYFEEQGEQEYVLKIEVMVCIGDRENMPSAGVVLDARTAKGLVAEVSPNQLVFARKFSGIRKFQPIDNSC